MLDPTPQRRSSPCLRITKPYKTMPLLLFACCRP
nr:MAG TPA: hypothetical protein [Caudoviricetes sp.]